MKIFAKASSCVALLLIVVPPLIYFVEAISLDTCKHLLATGTVLWFIVAPLWMRDTV